MTERLDFFGWTEADWGMLIQKVCIRVYSGDSGDYQFISKL